MWPTIGCVIAFIAGWMIMDHMRRQTAAIEKLAGITRPKANRNQVAGPILVVAGAALLFVLAGWVF